MQDTFSPTLLALINREHASNVVMLIPARTRAALAEIRAELDERTEAIDRVCAAGGALAEALADLEQHGVEWTLNRASSYRSLSRRAVEIQFRPKRGWRRAL
jgi:pyrroline-5-carboxylate reductase